MATSHLSDTQLRELIEYCCNAENHILHVRDVVKYTECNQGNFSSWKNGKYPTSRASLCAARTYCDFYFNTHTLPKIFRIQKVQHVIDVPTEAAAAVPAEKKSFGRKVKELLMESTTSATTTTTTTTEIILSKQQQKQKQDIVLSIASWNVKNLGGSTPQERRIRIASLLTWYDVTALQEVRKVSIEEVFRPTLDNTLYGIVQLAPSGSSRRQESTCFVYKRSSLVYVRGGLLPLDGCVYAPAFATFTLCNYNNNNTRFTLISVHISASLALDAKCRELERIREAVHDLDRSLVGEDVYIVGDFNVEPSERAAFTSWRVDESLRPVMEYGATTLAASSANCYDHIWTANANMHIDWRSARAAPMSAFFAPNVKGSRRNFTSQVSDHLPVIIELVYQPHDSTILAPKHTLKDIVGDKIKD